METYFSTCQEACQKDIKRAFRVLVQRFQISQCPLKNWYWEEIVNIMDVSIILHSMVVKNPHENYSVSEYMNTGRCWFAATDVFHPMTTANNSATINNDSTETNDNSVMASNNNSTTTTTTMTTNNNQPPIVSLFHVKEERDGDNILLEADFASHIAIRVVHMNERMKCQQEHFSLKSDLMNHLWQLRSNR
jgi:hypothetical protein